MKFSPWCFGALVWLGCCLAGCGPREARYVVVTGSDTGVYYQVGQAIDAAARRAEAPLHIGVRTSGGSVDNARQLGAGRADFAMIQNDIAAYALGGRAMFQSPIANLRGVAAFYPEHVHLVARADAGIRTVEDLAGRSLAIGDAGSGTEANALQVLEAHGLGEDELGTVERLGATQSAGRLQDGHLDAMFYTVGVGSAAIAELQTQLDLHFVPIGGSAREALLASHDFYSEAVIPAGAYGEGSPAQDTPTVAVRAVLAAREEVPPETVRAVLEAIFGHLETFRGRHARLREVTLEGARAGLALPLHPGARDFYGAGVPGQAETAPAGE